jgi:hypothetical protein
MGLLDPPAATAAQLAQGLNSKASKSEAGITPLSFAQRPPTPTLTKYPGITVGDVNSIGLSSIYVPWTIRVPDAVYNAYPQYGRWRIYTSTDHDATTGGIAIGVNPSDDTVLDPASWTWLRTGAGSAKMFLEGSGSQVETPCVVWNPDTNLFHMYYQNQSGSGASIVQQTRVVTSPDGVTNWSTPVTAIPTLDSSIAGWGHTGYAKVFYIDGLWCAWHLQGSGSSVKSGYGWSFSYDGITFLPDRRRVSAGLHMTDGVMRFGFSTLFYFRGSTWAIGSDVDAGATGKVAATFIKVWMAPINQSDDLRSLRGRPLFQPWTITAPETVISGPPAAYGVHPDGRLIGAYRINGETGSIAMAVLV